MDNIVESSIVEDFVDQPFKKVKCSEPDLLELERKKNIDPLTSPASPSSIHTLSPILDLKDEDASELDDVKQLEENKQIKGDTYDYVPQDNPMAEIDDDKQLEEPKQNKVSTYDYLPQDYVMTNLDLCAQIMIKTSFKNDVLVKIDDVYVTQHQLLCLIDDNQWLNDDVISAYICCIRDQFHMQHMDDAKICFENPINTGLLKRDGNIGIPKDGNFVTEIVRNYLKHEMIFLPVNIQDTHWYLAVINVQKYEIQVLDSLCWDFNRADLNIVLQGLQYHLDILESKKNLTKHNWKDLQVSKWPVKEQVKEPIQKDSSSCGLFMLKYMEYWTGDTLSHPITQETITLFRYKLAGILLCWKTNSASTITNLHQIHDVEGNPDDIMILEKQEKQQKSKALVPLSIENKYQSLISVLSKMSLRELVGGICDYISSIKCAKTLEKVWLQNSKPYPISLTLKQLQNILNDDLPMDLDCFNLLIRKIMYDDIQMAKKKRGVISKHYLDLQFWMITDFGRHPNFRKMLDMERLAASVRSWPGINYNVSTWKSILIPTQCHGGFVLFVLDKDTRTVYILDPTPLNSIFQYNPNARYVQKLLWIAEYLPKAMYKACPGSRWNENIFLWRQVILHDVPIYNRELSGYLVSLFMTSWQGEKLQLPLVKEDGHEIRKQFLGQLLAYKENDCEDNMPTGVLEFLSLINKMQKL